jgi:hypothetical protein
MLADSGDNFSILLNSQASGSNILEINSNGAKKYSNCIPQYLSDKAKLKKFKVSVNFVSNIVAESTLSGAAQYILEFSTGSNVQSIYINGSANVMTNSVMVPLETYPVVISTSALVSSYFFAKTTFTGRFPNDVFEVRVRNASDFAITSAFPNYILQATFEEVLETQTF